MLLSQSPLRVLLVLSQTLHLQYIIYKNVTLIHLDIVIGEKHTEGDDRDWKKV